MLHDMVNTHFTFFSAEIIVQLIVVLSVWSHVYASLITVRLTAAVNPLQGTLVKMSLPSKTVVATLTVGGIWNFAFV